MSSTGKLVAKGETHTHLWEDRREHHLEKDDRKLFVEDGETRGENESVLQY